MCKNGLCSKIVRDQHDLPALEMNLHQVPHHIYTIATTTLILAKNPSGDNPTTQEGHGFIEIPVQIINTSAAITAELMMAISLKTYRFLFAVDLIVPERLHAIPESEQFSVDVARLLQPLSRGIGATTPL